MGPAVLAKARTHRAPPNLGGRFITDEDPANEKAASEAAGDAADQNRLLPGEDTASRQLDDARHWLEVYTELLSFKSDLLRSTYEHLSDMDMKDARTEIRRTDEIVLEAEAERFERRRKFWEDRFEELSRG